MKKILVFLISTFLILGTGFAPVAAHDNDNNNHNCNINNDVSGNHYDAENCDKEIIYVDRIVYVDKIVEKIVYVDKIVEKTIYVDKEVEKIVYVDKPVIEYRDRIVYQDREVIREVPRIEYRDRIVYRDKEVIKEVEKIVYVEKEEEVIIEEPENPLAPLVCETCCYDGWAFWLLLIAAATGLINFIILLFVLNKKDKVVNK